MTVNGEAVELVEIRCPSDNTLVFECVYDSIVRGKCRKCKELVCFYKGLIFIEKK